MKILTSISQITAFKQNKETTWKLKVPQYKQHKNRNKKGKNAWMRGTNEHI